MAEVSFHGRVAIVTGAGSGLGRTYALDIARRGGAVVVNDLGGSVEGIGASPEAAAKVVAEITAAGGRAVASPDDVGSPAGARNIIEAALDSFGRLDAVINNAGNLRNAWFEDVSEDDLQSQLRTHLFGTYYVTQAAWPVLKQRRYGRIVFTTSGAGMLGNVGLSPYGAAKAGITGLMHVLSEEGGPHGILCNAVHPNALGRMSDKMGASQDPEEQARMTPWVMSLGASMQPEYTTGLAVYLASEACETTHSIYSSLGGRYARVFVGVTHGWQGARDRPASAEDVAAHIEDIRSTERGFHVPQNLMDEYRLLLANPLDPAR